MFPCLKSFFYDSGRVGNESDQIKLMDTRINKSLVNFLFTVTGRRLVIRLKNSVVNSI